MDEDEGDITAKRADGLCSTHARVPVQVRHQLPGQHRQGLRAPAPPRSARSSTTTGVTGDVVVGHDAGRRRPDRPPTDGCTPLTNAAAVTGKSRIVDRGTCAFTVKVEERRRPPARPA